MLNSFTVLDNGIVALISSNMNYKDYNDANELHLSQQHSKLIKFCGNATFYIKCPLYYQLFLSSFNIKMTNITQYNKKIEAYLPHHTELNMKDLNIAQDISDDIKRTTEALLLNPNAYINDGADKFIAQIITPINVYTDLVIHSDILEFQKIILTKTPSIITKYNNILEELINATFAIKVRSL